MLETNIHPLVALRNEFSIKAGCLTLDFSSFRGSHQILKVARAIPQAPVTVVNNSYRTMERKTPLMEQMKSKNKGGSSGRLINFTAPYVHADIRDLLSNGIEFSSLSHSNLQALGNNNRYISTCYSNLSRPHEL